MNLIFVYNTKNGVFNTLSDMVHKLLSQNKSSCDFSHLTQGYFLARDEWMNFLNDLDADIEFLHHHEYEQKYGAGGSSIMSDFPAIFVKEDDEMKLWMDSETMGEMTSTDELMETIRAALLRRQAGVENVDVFLSMPA